MTQEQRRSKLRARGGFVLQRKEQVRAFQRPVEISPPDFQRHLVIPQSLFCASFKAVA